jgi:endoglucanase
MSGVQKETTGDVGGGQDVGYIDQNDWMDYNVNAPTAGTYKINFRVATAASNCKFDLKANDGTVLTSVIVPNTGGWQTWQTITASVSLLQGQQTLRIYSTSASYNAWNINWLDVISPGITATPAPLTSTTFRVESENWAAMSGVQTETTTDTGGGKDVSYIDPNDWMDYSLNAPTSGTYTVSFRVASQSANAKFDVRNSDGTVLATITVPNTGGWQTWQTVTANVILPQGQQTLRLFSTAAQYNNWNINWMDFTTPVLSSISANIAGSSLEVSPNPVTDKFILSVNNNYTGDMDVQILDASGAIKKDFALTKSSTGSVQAYLSIGDLATGNYTVKVNMTQWNASTPIVKQ